MEVRTEIDIEASEDRIWEVLTNFEDFPNWNPFITRLSGTPEVGEKFEVTIHPPDSNPMTFKPTCEEAVPGKQLRWLGTVILPRIFDGEHIFEIEDKGDGTSRFIQRENFRGILVPFMRKMLNNNTRRGFEAMNQALKDKCESK